jgi:PAS domain S-box-containing protein
VGIFEVDAQGNTVFVNQYWSDLTGMTIAEALGQGWTRVLHPDDLEHIRAEINAAAEAGREFALAT